ncbi:hypothetical protein ACHMZP_32160 [Rhodococcus baikonurensis]|uniref:hypothetical protein n=1 Tax=Rhodococcus erythropolis group TaxID=2840174 RepID=UPI000BB3172B|nr:hypothetical protein [Rhodococcus erythropolis]PBI86895.1 hypothetical protein BKP42_63450 [Rhodococcus erythropolis]
MKTGSGNRRWMVLERPKPVKVSDAEDYWLFAPSQLSRRCAYWVRQIERGWLPNRRIVREGYQNGADWFGVYIWEYLNVLDPLITQKRTELVSRSSNA